MREGGEEPQVGHVGSGLLIFGSWCLVREALFSVVGVIDGCWLFQLFVESCWLSSLRHDAV